MSSFRTHLEYVLLSLGQNALEALPERVELLGLRLLVAGDLEQWSVDVLHEQSGGVRVRLEHEEGEV